MIGFAHDSKSCNIRGVKVGLGLDYKQLLKSYLLWVIDRFWGVSIRITHPNEIRHIPLYHRK